MREEIEEAHDNSAESCNAGVPLNDISMQTAEAVMEVGWWLGRVGCTLTYTLSPSSLKETPKSDPKHRFQRHPKAIPK